MLFWLTLVTHQGITAPGPEKGLHSYLGDLLKSE